MSEGEEEVKIAVNVTEETPIDPAVRERTSLLHLELNRLGKLNCNPIVII